MEKRSGGWDSKGKRSLLLSRFYRDVLFYKKVWIL